MIVCTNPYTITTYIMANIQLNEKGTHFLEVEDRHFQIISDYSLLHGLVDSTGYVTEQTLDKLKFNLKSLIAGADNPKPLIDLCYEVVYHPKMKGYGLRQLIDAYAQWEPQQPDTEE